jgi:hypothetical protein
MQNSYQMNTDTQPRLQGPDPEQDTNPDPQLQGRKIIYLHDPSDDNRYMTEMAIDPAICLSGWRMRIDNSQEPGDTGRLHVDYAQVT